MTVNKEKLQVDIYKEIEVLLSNNIDYIPKEEIILTVNEIIRLCEKSMV